MKEARMRGERGMQDIFDLYLKSGTPTRLWGEGEGVEAVKGELCGVAVGSVQVIMVNGSKKALKPEDLSEADEKYLDGSLMEEDKQVLWRKEEEGLH